MPIVALMAAAILSACGGADGVSSGDIASVAKSASAPSGASDAANQTSTAAGFFDDIFNTQAGSGYYIFGWNSIQSTETGGARGETGMTRTRLGVIDGLDTTLRQSYTPLTGNDALQTSKVVFVAAEGAFPADVLPYDDLGPATKIFQKLPDGFDFGVSGMSTPLYRVKFDVQDVSGQTVTSVADHFQGGHEEARPGGLLPLAGVAPMIVGVVNPLTVNMPRLVFPAGDTTLMPAGSRMYVPTYTAQTTFLRVDLSKKPWPNYTFDQFVKSFGKQVATLGGYRYTTAPGMGAAAYSFTTTDRYLVEYNGEMYSATMITAGDSMALPVSDPMSTKPFPIVAPSPAFNETAAAFLIGQLGASPQQTHKVNVKPSGCYQYGATCNW